MTVCTVVPLTAPGKAALAGLALIGEGAAGLVGGMLQSRRAGGAGTVRLALLSALGESLDEALVVERGPDRVEIFCHGGAVSARRIESALAARGAPRAGEEALRALEARARGWDRVQEEAAALLCAAATERAAGMLLAQMDGAFSRWIAVRLAAVEGGGDPGALAPDLGQMLSRCRYGRALVEQPLVAIAGPANAGKSTLMNRLCGDERAVVSGEAGTTRDPVEELVQWEGIPIRLVDTAGMSNEFRVSSSEPADSLLATRYSELQLDRASQQLSMDVLRRADWILAVFDGSSEDLPAALSDWKGSLGPRVFWIANNKSDVRPSTPELVEGSGRTEIVNRGWYGISAATGEGIDAMMAHLLEVLVGPLPDVAQPCPFMERHEELLGEAFSAVLQGDAAKVRSAFAALLG